MNKLLFTLRRDFNDDIILIANNHKDLADHLSQNYDWYRCEFTENYVSMTEMKGFEAEIATLEWVKHI